MSVSVSGSSITFNDGSTQNTSAYGGGFAMRNRIINGAMGIWQRGTSGFTTSGNYSADRWMVRTAGSLSTVAQSTDVPAGFKYSLNTAGSNFPDNVQRIEANNCSDLSGQTVTISFWLKQTVGAGSNSMVLVLAYANSADSFGSLTTIGSSQITATSSWAQYTATFTNLPANAVNGLQIQLYANTASSATWFLTGVQLEKGSTATSFDYRPYGTELQLCQRYYQKFISINGAYCTFGTGHVDSATAGYGTIVLPVTTRATATFGSSGSIAFYSGNSFYPITSFGTVYYTANTQGVNFTCSGGGMTAGRGGQIIANNSTTAYVDFNAEL